MALKCFKTVAYGATSYRESGKKIVSNGVEYPSWRTANSITTAVGTVATGYYAGCLADFLVVDNVQTNEWGAGWSITEDPGNPNCTPIPDRYDCLNGECIKDTVYDTPGAYEKLEECQSQCGTGNACQAPNICVPPDHCPDGYVCIGSDEWVEIKRLLS